MQICEVRRGRLGTGVCIDLTMPCVAVLEFAVAYYVHSCLPSTCTITTCSYTQCLWAKAMLPSITAGTAAVASQ